MSITISYRRLPQSEFETLMADPAQADEYFGVDIDEEDEESQIVYYDRLKASNCYLSIGKLWDGLHFLLTGFSIMAEEIVPPPLVNVVQGGAPTNWEATYGVVRYLTPEEVKEVAAALREISVAELRQQYDPGAFQAADIYPGDGAWSQSWLDPLLRVFGQVRDFFAEAAQAREVVLLSFD